MARMAPFSEWFAGVSDAHPNPRFIHVLHTMIRTLIFFLVPPITNSRGLGDIIRPAVLFT
jgi:hypothetical protein